MGETQKRIYFLFVFLLILQSYFMAPSRSQSIINSLPGYSGNLPFKLETGYVGIGENEEIELFYYFLESERNPDEDPLIFYMPGGPGASALLTLLYGGGPLASNVDNGPANITFSLNQNSWIKIANIIFIDNPAGTGFSYAKTKKAWTSSDTMVVTQTKEFLIKFLLKHPKFLRNPLYIAGVSYMGIVAPVLTLELYEGNERGDQPKLNIQGYILCSPHSNKFMDFNSRLEYAHRMALISDEIYKSAIENCHGNYVNIESANSLCATSLERYNECTSRINMGNILEPVEDDDVSDQDPNSIENNFEGIEIWANTAVVQQALKIRQGTIGKWEIINYTLHYAEGKADSVFYSYDIFSSFAYQKKLVSKNCRAIVFSGDHDMTFPNVGIEQWIASLQIKLEIPWQPFYVNNQVGGYEMTYAENNFSLTFASIKGAGHLVPTEKPKESLDVIERWLGYSSDSYM